MTLDFKRRDFLKTILAGIPALALDWPAFHRKEGARSDGEPYDALIIGAGLGGLSCAAAFARQGFKPLVLEQHTVPGGYATTFRRAGGFVFDASLHSTTVEKRNGIPNLIPGFPEIEDIVFVPHKGLYRVVYPEHDIRVPNEDPESYIKLLTGIFPEEKAGIEGVFKDMKGLSEDLARYSRAGGKVDMSRVPVDFPTLFKCFQRTWGAVLESWIADPKLRAVISALWGYFGLPPSRLASLYYMMPTWGYLVGGGYYPIGKSQKISDALVEFIEERGGNVKLGTRVDKILVREHAAYGVQADDGERFEAGVVVSNANAYDTFHSMMDESAYLKDYLARMDGFSISLSSYQIFLGLNRDLTGETGIEDSEIFFNTGYDVEDDYRAALEADIENQGFGLTLYDNLYPKYSPAGKNTVNITVLQGFKHWEKYAAAYWKGDKAAYRKEKERMADILIAKVEKALLPGLKDAVEVMEIGTPLTNIRYTGNTRGAIYGWDQTLDNAMPRRLGHKTPIANLFLAGAWTQPGGGYGAVIPSGLSCFGEIMKEWKS